MITRHPGERLVYAGLGLFLAGVSMVLLTVVPVLFGTSDPSVWLDLAGVPAMVGLCLTIAGFARGKRAADRGAAPPDAATIHDDVVRVTFAAR